MGPSPSRARTCRPPRSRAARAGASASRCSTWAFERGALRSSSRCSGDARASEAAAGRRERGRERVQVAAPVRVRAVAPVRVRAAARERVQAAARVGVARGAHRPRGRGSSTASARASASAAARPSSGAPRASSKRRPHEVRRAASSASTSVEARSSDLRRGSRRGIHARVTVRSRSCAAVHGASGPPVYRSGPREGTPSRATSRAGQFQRAGRVRSSAASIFARSGGSLAVDR